MIPENKEFNIRSCRRLSFAKEVQEYSLLFIYLFIYLNKYLNILCLLSLCLEPSIYLGTGKFMSIGMSIIYELKKSMSELYGIQHVGWVKIQRPDQASKNLAWHISGSETVMVYSLHIKLWSAMHPLGGSICASQHILSVLAEEKMVLLSLPKTYSLHAL